MSAFDTAWDTTIGSPIDDAAEETALVMAAKLGDETATMHLFATYLPVLKIAVGRASATLDRDDARQTAVLGLLAAIQAFDPAKSDRLAALIRERLQLEMQEAVTDEAHGFAVPSRTLRRAQGILARANGSIEEGARLAPSFQMSAETFRAVLDAPHVWSLEERVSAPGTRNAEGRLNVQPIYADREVPDAEAHTLCDLAFNAVTKEESLVCRMAYGFTDPEPVPDAEIGHRLGMGRVQTLRIRHRAVDKMRAAVGA